MSSLKPLEKRLFEDILEMSGGYVLDFTNDSFAEFFRDTVGVDIYSQKYAFNGDSKAKRIRAFWEVESDRLVGKVLQGLIEVWEYNQLKKGRKTLSPQYGECKSIVARLLGQEITSEDPGKRFLNKRYDNISIAKLQVESALVPILESRLTEAHRCLQKDAPLAVIFLCGSILEGILLGVALRKPKEFNQAANSPKDRNGKVKPFQDWTLSQLIDVAYGIGLLKLDVKKFSHELRDFRNYIHPHQQMVTGFRPDKHTAEICLQVLKAAIADLGGARR